LGKQAFHNFSVHATGFFQWLMTKFLSADFIRRKFVVHYCHAEIFSVGQEPNPSEVGKTGEHLLMCRKFSVVQQHCPPKLLAIRYSLLATHYLLLAIRCRFRLGNSLALPNFRLQVNHF